MAMTTERRIDYSDCVNNFREYAVRLEELAGGEVTRQAKFVDVVPYLEKTARSLEEHEVETTGTLSGLTPGTDPA